LALFIFSLYNPDSPIPNLSSAPQQASVGSLPKVLFPIYKKMLNPNARTRLPTTRFVDEVEATGYWSGNNLIELVESLEGFELAGESEKISLLRRIKESVQILPPPFLISKILPSLLHSLSLPSAPASHILPLVLSIGKDVPPHRYNAVVLDPVVKLYASPDRGTRMALLEGLTEYGDKLEKSVVSDKVWPHLITGFADTVAVIREATVKAIPVIAPKVNTSAGAFEVQGNQLTKWLRFAAQRQIIEQRLAETFGENASRPGTLHQNQYVYLARSSRPSPRTEYEEEGPRSRLCQESQGYVCTRPGRGSDGAYGYGRILRQGRSSGQGYPEHGVYHDRQGKVSRLISSV